MDRQIITKLKEMKPLLRDEMQIRDLWVFGSFARGEETSDSDIDLLVDFEETPGLIAFCGMRRKISDLLGREVDLVTRDALHPLLKDQILREAINV